MGTSDFQSEGNSMRIQDMAISQIKLNPRNARTHSAKQIRQIAKSIVEFGFTNPLLVDEDGELIAGHGRYRAAELLGIGMVPVIIVAGLSPAKRRALAIADNKIAENAGWDRERLAIELPELTGLLSAEGLDISILGFGAVEIDNLQTDFEHGAADPQDKIEPKWGEVAAVSKPGDLWMLGNHKVLCGDARCAGDVARLMAGCRADLAFLDLPRGEVTGPSPRAMADEAMSTADFVRFIGTTLEAAASASREGAIHFVCTDRQHLAELMAAAEPIYGKASDVAVWPNSDADPGPLYRGGLEFIGVFCVGPLTITPGRRKRSRSNVCRYGGATVLLGMDGLRSGPAAKPVALIADAIEDATGKGDVVLDILAGTGTTILAAERVGRRARALEAAPQLVDVAVRRWQAATRRTAAHAESGLSFDQIAADAARTTPPNPAKTMENDR
jgi:ParB-like nuclease domain/DNA methylase